MQRLLFLILNIVAVAFGQGAPAPAISAAPSAADCSGCYVIADVAAIVFGDEQLMETATNLVSVGVGKNGTQVTTSFIQAGPAFSFAPTGLITGTGGGGFAPFTGTVITVSGATLTSPTAYNVFTAYSITSIGLSNGQCVTSSGSPIQLSSAFSVAIPDNPSPNFIFQAEESFINKIGGVTCAPGGVQISSTTQVSVGTTTVSNTVTGPLRPTPAQQSSVAGSTSTKVVSALPDSVSSSGSTGSQTAATSTGGTGTGVIVKPSSTVVSTVSLSNNATGTLVIVGNSTGIVTGSGPTQTIIPFTGAASVIFKPSVVFGAAALLLPGIFAWML